MVAIFGSHQHRNFTSLKVLNIEIFGVLLAGKKFYIFLFKNLFISLFIGPLLLLWTLTHGKNSHNLVHPCFHSINLFFDLNNIISGLKTL